MSTTTSEIITSKTHIDPLRDDGYVIYKIGYIHPVSSGRREVSTIWGNHRPPTTPTATGILVSLTAHGFIVGDNIKATTTGWTKAKADTKANAKCVGKVCQVIDENTFRYITTGLLAGSYTAGTRYYLSTATAGADMTEPTTWTAGQYRQYIGTGTTDGLMVEIDEGEEVTATSSVSAPGTITSSSSNSDNGTNHYHALDDLFTSVKNAELAKLTVDKKGRITAISDVSTSYIHNNKLRQSQTNISQYRAASVEYSVATHRNVRFTWYAHNGTEEDSGQIIQMKLADNSYVIVTIKANTKTWVTQTFTRDSSYIYGQLDFSPNFTGNISVILETI